MLDVVGRGVEVAAGVGEVVAVGEVVGRGELLAVGVGETVAVGEAVGVGDVVGVAVIEPVPGQVWDKRIPESEPLICAKVPA